VTDGQGGVPACTWRCARTRRGRRSSASG